MVSYCLQEQRKTLGIEITLKNCTPTAYSHLPIPSGFVAQ